MMSNGEKTAAKRERRLEKRIEKRPRLLGGQAIVPPVEIPSGRIARMKDTEGKITGLWKAK